MTNEGRVLAVLTNERQVLGVLTNKRRVLGLLANERLTCPLVQLVGQLQSCPALSVPHLQVTVAVQEHHGDVVVAAHHGQVQSGVTVLEIVVKIQNYKNYCIPVFVLSFISLSWT